ncbi:hypothetical protein FKZ61_018370, partial [Litorilinea aerophila]|nr:hypothetical protein [Litorilinea aerophila]
GNRTRVTVKKNKVAPPFKVAEFDIMYNEGISTEGDLIDLGVEQDIITKRGSFYSYGDIRLGQGRENAKQFLAENPDLMAEIDAKIREAFGLPVNLVPRAGGTEANEGKSTPAPKKTSTKAGSRSALADDELAEELDDMDLVDEEVEVPDDLDDAA